jgi:hypothetical protein
MQCTSLVMVKGIFHKSIFTGNKVKFEGCRQSVALVTFVLGLEVMQLPGNFEYPKQSKSSKHTETK